MDPDLGTVQVARVVGAFAAGRIINPKTAHSQAIGGIVGGLGMALLEETVWDPRNGRVAPGGLELGERDADVVDARAGPEGERAVEVPAHRADAADRDARVADHVSRGSGRARRCSPRRPAA